MKNIVFLLELIIGFIFISPLYAIEKEEIEKLDTKQIIETEVYNYPVNNASVEEGSVSLYYYPVFKEARIIFICKYRTYKEDIAVISIRNALTSFIKENKYYSYKFLSSDKYRVHKDPDTKEIYIRYESHVKINN